jgi:membrane fusion protein, heavy metal efflux system
MNRHVILALSVLTASTLASCHRTTAPPPPAETEVKSDTKPGARELRVTPELQQKWGLSTGEVSRVSVAGAVTLPGVLALNQLRTARVSSLLEGTVSSVSVDQGQQVRKGDVLLVVQSPALAEAESTYIQAHARRAVARRELDRARELMKDEAIQQKELQRRQADFDSATTDIGLAEARLHALGMDHPQLDALIQRAGKPGADLSDVVEPTFTVRAPLDGRVISRDVVVGEHVHPDKLLFVVSDLSTLWAMLDAREKDLPNVVQGARVTLSTEVYQDRRFEGSVSRVGDTVDESLRTIKVRVDVPNPGLVLKPNMFVQGSLDTKGASKHDVMAVPEDAVQTIDGEPAVFVAAGERGFVARPVAVGDRVGKARTILRGLDGSERVVVTGAFNLKAELLKSSFAGE